MIKKLKINHKGIERKLQYEVFLMDSEYGNAYTTEFYEGTETKTHKKYWLFGETITTEEPKLIFELNYDVENIFTTKHELRATLHRQLELLDRAEEIANGELI